MKPEEKIEIFRNQINKMDKDLQEMKLSLSILEKEVRENNEPSGYIYSNFKSEQRQNKWGKWLFAFIVFILTWSVGGAGFTFLVQEQEVERYSGVISLIIGIVLFVIIIVRNAEDDGH